MRSPRRALRPFALAAFALIAAAPPASAQLATLARDVNPSPIVNPGSLPLSFATAGGRLVFAASEPYLGWHLWASDGTAVGTTSLGLHSYTVPTVVAEGDGVVYLLTSGDAHSASERLWRTDGTPGGTWALTPDDSGVFPSYFFSGSVHAALVGDLLLFEAASPITGVELWVSDGTPEGTGLLADLCSGSCSSFPRLFTALDDGIPGDRVLFFADEPGGQSLWVSDGTAAGTVRLKDLGSVRPYLAGAAGGRLFFLGQSFQLWTSDGTAAGTRMIRQFTGANPFDPATYLLPWGDRVVFAAAEGAQGPELWASDGTPRGTQRLTDLAIDDPYSLALSRPVALGDFLLFAATDLTGGRELFRTDGTAAGTALVRDLCPGSCSAISAYDSTLYTLGEEVFFLADDGRHGAELWASDGTAAGTFMVADVCPGSCAGVNRLRREGDLLFFAGTAPQPKVELWATDGTTAGTRRLTDLEPYEPLLQDYEFTLLQVAGRTYFVADDGRHGMELWATDGTREGTGLVADLLLGGAPSYPHELVAAGGRAFFFACEEPGESLWASRGSEASTVRLTSRDLGAHCGSLQQLTAAGGRLFFLARGDHYYPDLWVADGTPGGSRALTHFADEIAAIGPLAAAGNRLYFALQLMAGGGEVWVSDGTPAGTRRAFTPGPEPIAGVTTLSAVGEELFVITYESNRGYELWVSDGTDTGTRRLTPLLSYTLPLRDDPEIARAGETTYFSLTVDWETGHELWASDGTPTGTRLVQDIAFGGASSFPTDLTPFQGRLYFFAQDELRGRGLWVSDGTDAGTRLVREFVRIPPGEEGPLRAELTVVGDRLFFAADDGLHGRELWVSDGTTAGTRMVKDLYPGRRSSELTSLTAAGGRLYFSARDRAHGTELWTSDGTTAGTRMVHDLAPGPVSSTPLELTVAGERLYFAADDGFFGWEPWSLPLAPESAGCLPGGTAVCLQGRRYRVEIGWLNGRGKPARARATRLTADTGTFWFTDAANVETVVKVLDGRNLNDHVWVFYGALSNLEYALTVTDGETGLSRRYTNPLGRFASVGDTRAFGPQGASLAGYLPPAEELFAAGEPEVTAGRASTGACAPSDTRLCLQGGRFAVEATWRNRDRGGVAQAVPLTGDTGYFWFFNRANVEVVLKVLDGTAVNGRFWVFYGALSNVEYTLTVTDTDTGAVKTYRNPAGRFASVGDTRAF